MTRQPAPLFAALCLAAAALPCTAQTRQTSSTLRTREVITGDPSQRVRATTLTYTDLDLSSAAGRQTLIWRIEGAARAVCGPPPERPFTSRSAPEAYDQCQHTALAGALRQLRIARLPALAMAGAPGRPAN